MAKTEITKQIEHALCREFNRQYGCLEVSIGIGSQIKERCDYMVFDHYKSIFKCFEIKVSKQDFHSSAATSFVGHYNYYAMPWELYVEVADEIPKGIGIYTFSKTQSLSCERKASKKDLSDKDVMLLKDSMIRSLSRDANKFYLSDDETTFEKQNREVSRAKREKEHYYQAYVSTQRKFLKLEKVLNEMFGREYVQILLNKK